MIAKKSRSSPSRFHFRQLQLAQLQIAVSYFQNRWILSWRAQTCKSLNASGLPPDYRRWKKWAIAKPAENRIEQK